MELLRDNQFKTERVEPSERSETPMTPEQIRSALAGRDAGKEPLNEEREEKIEAWMNNIKEFIRKIDVNGL